MLWLHSCNGATEEEGISRRLFIMYVMIYLVVTCDVNAAPPQKGITHCLLPECNSLVWPFMNYCGRGHADLGKQRGLQRKLIFTEE